MYDSYSVFTFFVCIVLFLLFRQEVEKHIFSSGAKILIREISDNTFGIYVMHPAVLEYLQIRGINSTSGNNIIGISLLALGCFVICNIAAALLRRIPVVGRYLC